MKRRDLNLVNAAPLHVRRSYILGCGGMGTEAANHFKRALVQRFDTRYLKALQVLCFDSAQPDYTPSENCLEAHEHMRVYASDLRQVVENLSAHPRIAEWFPSSAMEKAREIVRELANSAQGAASTRPFGRIGIFEHWQSIYSRIRGLAETASGTTVTLEGKPVPVEESDAQHFYVIASLGGGTGTGIFLDIAAIVRKLQHDLGRTEWQVHAILVLPEILVRDPNVPRNYSPQIMANSYAALKELDHFLHDNEFEARYGEGADTVVRIGERERIGRLFDRVYLVDAENGSARACASRDEMAGLIGEMLFHLTATEAGRDLERRIPDAAARLLFQEKLPTEADREKRQEIVRERRRCLYSTFGHSTLRIPVDRLLEFCAYQRAFEVFERIVGEEEWDPEEIAAQVSELMRGGGAEQPLLEQLAMTSANLDRALDLARHLQALPTVTQILREGIPSDQIRGLFAIATWTPERREQWATRAEAAGDQLRRALIEGEIRTDLKTKNIETIRGRIALKVDEIYTRDGPRVADIVLDRIEEELVKIKAEAEPQLAKLKRDLELEGNNENEAEENRFWRNLGETLQDIEENERRSGLFRAQSNQRRVGDEIDGALSGLEKLRRLYINVPRLTEKIRLCQDLIDEINRQDDRILPARAKGFKTIRDELRARRNQALVACESGGTPTLRYAVRRREEIYENHYLPHLGAQGMPANMADQLRREGVTLKDGTHLSVEHWGEHPIQVAEALYRLCASVTDLDDDARLPNSDDPGAVLWGLDFDSRFFSDTGIGDDDFDGFARELTSYAVPYLQYDALDAPNQPWSKLISGSCRSRQGRNWTQWLKLESAGGAIFPGARNQVTLLCVRKAFPLYRIKRIKEWKRYYDEYYRKQWPLHLFAGAGEWNEPYIREADEPDYEANALFQEALAREVIRPHGTGQFTYDHPREEVRSLFQDENNSAKGLDPTAFEEALTRHRILAREILEDVVEKIIATDGRDLEAKVQSGVYPAFLRKEIEAYLRGES